MLEKLDTHTDKIKYLDDSKADKKELENFKKVIQNLLAQSGGNVDFKGIDDLAELMKRLDEIELKLHSFMTLNDKNELSESLEELKRVVKDITDSKLPIINSKIEENTAALKILSDETKRLELHKLDKQTFDDFVK